MKGTATRCRAALLVAVAVTLSSPARAAPRLEPPKRIGEAPVAYPSTGTGDARVSLTVLVNAEGTVTDLSVRDGASPFAEAAVAAVKTWHFLPATRDDAPVSSRILVVVEFHPSASKPAQGSGTLQGALAPATPAAAEEVTVRGPREEPGTIHLPTSIARFIPGAFGDPFRVIEALPGMTPWRSGLPYYYVRGSAPESVGYAIDGIRVPILFHTGAGPSVISPALVESVDLFPAAYPARFGRSTGAIIAGETKAPETERARAEVGVRLFDANALVEVPYDNGKGSALAAARYGYTGLLTSIFAPEWSLDYWDYQARVSHRTWGHDTVSLFVFGAHDDGGYQGDTLFHVEYHRADLRYDHPLAGGDLRVAATLSTDDTFTAAPAYAYAATLRGPGGRLRMEMEERVLPEVLVRAGGELGVTRFDVDSRYSPHTDLEGGVYGDVVWRPSPGVEVVPGFRLDAYEARGDTGLAPQPRVSAKFRIAPNAVWISAVGVAHQEPTENVLVPDKLPSLMDDLPRDAYQYSEALQADFPLRLRLRVTGFYTKVIARSGFVQEENEGLEMFLQRDFTERLGGFVAYTISHATEVAGGLTNTASPVVAPWDRNHVLSAVLSYDLGRAWRAGVRFFVESGEPYQVACPSSACTPSSAPEAKIVHGTLPPFYRVNARIEKRWTFSDGKWLAGTLECFNALHQGEPVGAYYSHTTGLTVETLTPLFLPSVGLEGGL